MDRNFMFESKSKETRAKMPFHGISLNRPHPMVRRSHGPSFKPTMFKNMHDDCYYLIQYLRNLSQIIRWSHDMSDIEIKAYKEMNQNYYDKMIAPKQVS